MTTHATWSEQTFGQSSESVKQAILQWSYTTEHPIARIMIFCTVPAYVPCTIWVFSKTMAELDHWKALGHVEIIARQALSLINSTGLHLVPSDLQCEFDSEENIEVNHGGNYFRRIRPRHGRP